MNEIQKIEESKTKSPFENSYVVSIGINDYQNFPSLSTAINDAEQVAATLVKNNNYQAILAHQPIPPLVENFNCQITSPEQLKQNDGLPVFNSNSTLAQIRNVFCCLKEKVTSEDCVLFYFAGHGIADESEDGIPKGYLLPKDAREEDYENHLSMEELLQLIEELECKHFLMILDCCFAGAIKWSNLDSRYRGTQPRKERVYQEKYDQYVNYPAWQVITSSAHNQEALDVSHPKLGKHGVNENNHSPFASVLLTGLQGNADISPHHQDGSVGDGIITANELYQYLRDTVNPQAKDQKHEQTPNIVYLKKHDNGEYIFLTKDFVYNHLPKWGKCKLILIVVYFPLNIKSKMSQENVIV